MRDVLDLGERRADEAHERRALVGLLEHVADRFLGGAGRDAHVDGREDAAIDRDEVRRERHRPADPLLDLGAVAVVEDAVGRHAAVDFGEVRPLGRCLAGAGDARLGVDDDVAVGGEQAGFGQRRQGEQGGGGVAARVGDELRPGDGAALPLGEAVGEPGRQPVRVRIPLGARGFVAQAEGAGEVDDADAGVHEGGRELGGRRIRQREEHDVGVARQCGGRERHDGAVPHARQCGQPPRRGAGLARRHRRGQRDGGMARQQPQQFLAGEAGGAGNRDAREGDGAVLRIARLAGLGCTGLHNCMHQKE